MLSPAFQFSEHSEASTDFSLLKKVVEAAASPALFLRIVWLPHNRQGLESCLLICHRHILESVYLRGTNPVGRSHANDPKYRRTDGGPRAKSSQLPFRAARALRSVAVFLSGWEISTEE